MWNEHADETFYERHAAVCMVVVLIVGFALLVVPAMRTVLASVQGAL